MNFGFLFKAAGALLVIGGIFIAGFLAGGSFATGIAEGVPMEQIERCLPITSTDLLSGCLEEQP